MSTIQLRSSRASLAGHGEGVVGASAAIRSLARTAQRFVEILVTWHERARQRRLLSVLSDHMLRDIGLSRQDVSAEVSKPFWQP